MAARRAPHSAQQQMEIGAAVLAARAVGTPWKLLMRVYDRDRVTLWQCADRVRRLKRFHRGGFT